MNELITVTEKNGQQLVNARELHEYLESGQQFSNWIQNRIEKYEFVENQDFLIILFKTPDGGRPSKDYALTLDMAKELSMVENNAKGREARKYFIEVEKRYKNQELTSLLDNPIPHFKQLISYSEKLKEENKILLPKAKTWDFVSQEKNCITFTTIAKMIPSIETAAKLKQILKNWKYIFKNGQAAKKGYEIYYRPYLKQDSNTGKLRGNLGVTPDGIVFTLNKLHEKNYITLELKEGILRAFKELAV